MSAVETSEPHIGVNVESRSQLRKHLACFGGRRCAEEAQSERWRRATDGKAAESFHSCKVSEYINVEP